MVEIREGCSIKIGCKRKSGVQMRILKCLRENVEAFAWSVGDMPGINPDVICHRLTTNSKMKPVV